MGRRKELQDNRPRTAYTNGLKFKQPTPLSELLRGQRDNQSHPDLLDEFESAQAAAKKELVLRHTQSVLRQTQSYANALGRKHFPSLKNLTHLVNKCSQKVSADEEQVHGADVESLCTLVSDCVQRKVVHSDQLAKTFVRPPDNDVWEQVVAHLIKIGEVQLLSQLAKLFAESQCRESRALLKRAWNVAGCVDAVTTETEVRSRSVADTQWMCFWLDIVFLQDDGKQLMAGTLDHLGDIHKILAFCNLAVPPKMHVLVKHTLFQLCVELTPSLLVTDSQLRNWFGKAATAAVQRARRESDDTVNNASSSSSSTTAASTSSLFKTSPASIDAHFAADHLKCLRLCDAEIKTSSILPDTPYLLFWSKRALRMFGDDDAMWKECTELPPPMTVFSLYVSVICAHEKQLKRDGSKPTAQNRNPFLGFALAFMCLANRLLSSAEPVVLREDERIKLQAMVTEIRALELRHALIKSCDAFKFDVTVGTSLRSLMDQSATSTDILPSSGEVPTSASAEWEWRKKHSSARSVCLDDVMKLIGLESIKREFLRVFDFILLQKFRGSPLSQESFHVRFEGGSGTGKSLVSKLYVQLLSEMSALSNDECDEQDAQAIVDGGVKAYHAIIDLLRRKCGGLLVIDRAVTLDPMVDANGRSIVSAINVGMPTLQGLIAFVFTGSSKELDMLFGYSTTLNNRVPSRWRFEDYTQVELQQLFQHLLNKKNSRFKVEGGFNGSAVRIVTQRLANQRGPDFGNGHAVVNLIALILRRQAERIQRAKLVATAKKSVPESSYVTLVSKSTALTTTASTGAQSLEDLKTDSFWLTFEDIVGPNPFTALETSVAYKTLMDMVGLKQVKREVQQLIEVVRGNYERELRGEAKTDIQLNRVFLGSPGTGKTSVAALYGEIMRDLGVLSKGDYQIRGASDLIGSALGESEKKANAILNGSKGCVLVIDEAYSLDPGKANDPYRKAVLDALVEKVQPSGDADRVVLLLGYKEPIESMMRNANPGLARRFDWSNPIVFEDFTEEELLMILNDALRKKSITATLPALMMALDRLNKKRRLPNFGNAGEVNNMVNSALTQYITRTRNDPNASRLLLPEDFEQQSDAPLESIDDIFRPMLGCTEIQQRLRTMHSLIQKKKAKGMDFMRSLNLNFILVGRPGTGKSSTASLLGRVFHSNGVLASPEVITVSAAKLQAPFVGQTAALVRETFKSALGKVLFIDEAYRLDPGQSPHSFMKEAMDEMVNILTEAEFKGKLVVVMAGYTREMHQMLKANQGLSSRFPEEFEFPTFTIDDSLALLNSILAEQQYKVDKEFQQEVHVRNVMGQIVRMDSFASGRDIHAIASRIEMDLADSTDDACIVSVAVVLAALRRFLTGIRARDNVVLPKADTSSSKKQLAEFLFQHDHAKPVEIKLSTDIAVEADTESDSDSDESKEPEEDLDALSPEEVQQRLGAMGACGAGFGWKRRDKGWICEGNVCIITDEEFRSGKRATSQ